MFRSDYTNPYDNGEFLADFTVYHKLGFIFNPLYDKEVKFIGIKYNDGHGHDHDFIFKTDGDIINLAQRPDPCFKPWYGQKEPPKYECPLYDECKLREVFLKEFDNFETKFYSYVDKKVSQSV